MAEDKGWRRWLFCSFVRDQGRQTLGELPERGNHGARAIGEQAERVGWNPTKLRKASQKT
jgi:hypothetical protein